MFTPISFDLSPRLEAPRILRIFLSLRHDKTENRENKAGDRETLRWIKTRRYARGIHNKNFIGALHYSYLYDSPASRETLQVVIIEQNSRKNKLIEAMQRSAAKSRAYTLSRNPFAAFRPCRFVSLTDLGKSCIERGSCFNWLDEIPPRFLSSFSLLSSENIYILANAVNSVRAL